MNTLKQLIEKYNQPVPRYTSYPTVPFWDNAAPDKKRWKTTVKDTFQATNTNEGISLYLHLPFCESLCTYCGCNKRITRNHAVEPVYLQAILKEWAMYREVLEDRPVIREIHLGGGTPTFFSPENLATLLTKLLEGCEIHPEHEFSFEGHPNNTTREHLQALYELGFRRVSYGVQDLSLKVQQAINRMQPFENVKNGTEMARETGYTSVNFDLIYGLPFQTLESIKDTFEQVITLQPDRIAFYSYAHVPWKEKSQRAYSEEDLPQDEEKFALYELGREMLLKAGYHDVGMDHFAKAEDDLYQAKQEIRLHRNFMGYTTNNTKLLIGLGVSAISDAFFGYMQNVKTVEEYYALLKMDELPIVKGYFCTTEDVEMRKHILEVACTGKTTWSPADALCAKTIVKLLLLQADGLITMGHGSLQVTPLGNRFIRNICNAFDVKMHAVNQEGSVPEKMFSKAV
ncbi:oxygen-independent coproporphyrinogen III oxidase [Adhaeribacter sp. BT258]|uniref:Coproporphyrinogen-III oxidase n=1 Tax=Adhaeribacter terrigena TaxID=2793070 RepID=A0ABS1BXN0_9BACT|nr:oxygen-independent coproporphyrinogen III oxidase [Adhaeribacter terrigena]MBK0401676.1 oxygen-independent coproporphyrinogen III oxidase [Adhaeribacter terrigena]